MATGRDEEGNLLTSITNQGDDYLQYAKEAGGNRTMYLEGQLSYSRLLADNHQIDGLLLYNMRDYVQTQLQPFIHYRIVHKVSLLVCHIAIKADISSKETSGITVQRTLVKGTNGDSFPP